jgi:hypothetical protein
MSSRQVKHQLVRLLFGPLHARKNPESHRQLDPSHYSYDDLRKAYLERMQIIHPDKVVPSCATGEESYQSFRQRKVAAKLQFVELQDAWKNYEEVNRHLQKVGNPETANFTLFGVGCSFADSPEERALRDEITEQACRGWFSSGVLTMESQNDVSSSRKPLSLFDEDLFVKASDDSNEKKQDKGLPLRSLVIPGHYKK